MSHNIDEDRQRCEPCALDGDKADAEGFCVKCVEYLCKGCVKDHRKNKATRGHRVLSGDEVPSDSSVFKRMNELMLCSEHPEITFEYKCENHDQFICSKCLVTRHRKCEKIVDIPNKQSGEIGDHLTSMFTKTLDDVSKLRMSNEYGKRHMCKQQERVEMEVHKFIEELVETFKTLSEKLNFDANELVQKEVTALNEDICKCDKLEKDIISIDELLKAVKNFGDDEELAVIPVLLKRRIGQVQSNVATLSTRNELCLKFQGSQTLTNITALGSVLSARTDRRLVDVFSATSVEASSDEIIMSELTHKVDQRPTKFPIKMPYDKHICCITGSLILPNGYVAVIDKNNKKMKVFRSNFDFAFEITLTEIPTDLCLVNSCLIAVIFENTKLVKSYQVADFIYKKHEFETSLYCLNIAKYSFEMQVLILMSQKLNGQGTIELQVRDARSGQFIKRIEVAKHRVGGGDISRIHVLDNSLLVTKYKKINCYTLSDHILGEEWFHKLDIEDVTDVISDESGCIYISGKKSNKIMKFTDLTSYQHVTLVSNVPAPTSISTDTRNSRLIVCCENNNFVYVFQFQ